MAPYKQAILVRTDLKMGKGKIAAQVGHACVESVYKSHESMLKEWRKCGMGKIVCKVADKKELYKYKTLAEDLGLVTSVITDGGHTQVEPGTVTCMAIGPAPEKEVDRVIGELKLL